jgi:hypothetical protein
LRCVADGLAEREAIMLRALFHPLGHGKTHGQDCDDQEGQDCDRLSHRSLTALRGDPMGTIIALLVLTAVKASRFTPQKTHDCAMIRAFIRTNTKVRSGERMQPGLS